jgi:hypothetical protein
VRSAVTDVLACGEAELGLLIRAEQEVGQERHASVLRVEPRDPRALGGPYPADRARARNIGSPAIVLASWSRVGLLS